MGSWITFPCEASVEILAKSGFDWLVLDMEHAPLGVEVASRLIRIIDLMGIPAICRLPSMDSTMVKNVLDAGASGIIVPMIETAADAQRIVDSVYYPPKGKRGVGLGRAHDYGKSFESYRKHAECDLLVIAMIETASGVKNVESIAATPGIDGLLIGPYDLSGSLGVIGALDHASLTAAKKKVLKASKNAKIGCGLHVVHPDAKTIRAAIEQGYNFLALGVDMILLDEASRAILSLAKDLKK